MFLFYEKRKIILSVILVKAKKKWYSNKKCGRDTDKLFYLYMEMKNEFEAFYKEAYDAEMEELFLIMHQETENKPIKGFLWFVNEKSKSGIFSV